MPLLLYLQHSKTFLDQSPQTCLHPLQSDFSDLLCVWNCEATLDVISA